MRVTLDDARVAAVASLARGAGVDAIEASLVRRGLDRDSAARLVAETQAELSAERVREVALQRPLATAFVAAVPAALAAGALWAVTVDAGGARFGPLAWLVGLASGAAVSTAAHRRGTAAQLVAASCAALGLLLGKELAFALRLHDLTGGRVGTVSLDAARAFFSNVDAVAGGADALPLVLALWGAWTMARAHGLDGRRRG